VRLLTNVDPCESVNNQLKQALTEQGISVAFAWLYDDPDTGIVIGRRFIYRCCEFTYRIEDLETIRLIHFKSTRLADAGLRTTFSVFSWFIQIIITNAPSIKLMEGEVTAAAYLSEKSKSAMSVSKLLRAYQLCGAQIRTNKDGRYIVSGYLRDHFPINGKGPPGSGKLTSTPG